MLVTDLFTVYLIAIRGFSCEFVNITRDETYVGVYILFYCLSLNKYVTEFECFLPFLTLKYSEPSDTLQLNIDIYRLIRFTFL